MAVVSNNYTSNNPDIDVKDRTTTDGKKIHGVYIDIGAGSAESPVTAVNPLPVTGTVTVDTSLLATEATLDALRDRFLEVARGSSSADRHVTIGYNDISNGYSIWSGDGAPQVSFAPSVVTIGNVNLNAGTNNIGDVDIASIAAGTNNIGDVDVASIAAGSNLVGDVALQPRASATGWDTVMSLDIDSTAVSIKGIAGKFGGYFLFNASAATVYVKLYNLTSVNPASDIPKMVFGIPAGSPANLELSNGIAFSTGIMVRAVTGVANTNTGDPGANALVGTFYYK
jgi:hypothetical protein